MASATHASIGQGLVAMTANPLRTVLSTLGIVIGVASVIATLALTDGLEEFLREQAAAQTDVQSISVASKTTVLRDGFSFPVGGYPVFGPEAAADLQRRLASAGEVTMIASGSATVASDHAAPHAASVTATLANYLAFGRKDVEAGRFFTDGEASRNAPIVVLSYLLAAELSPTGDPALMVGRVVRVRGRPLITVGVMQTFTGELGFQVFVPVRAAQMTFAPGARITPSLIVRARTIESVNDVRSDIEEWLASRYRNWDAHVSITLSAARLEQVLLGLLVLKFVMGAIAGISLVVGGIGIMNVLLASVAERTREIGVRKALGARRRDILFQFLAESVAIAGVGSGLGTTAGFILAFSLAALLRFKVPGTSMRAAITAGTLGTAVVSAAVIGLTFGMFPALRAARLSPIDAIRHD